MSERISILNERELEHLRTSSGDDVDMALVECVVRELRHLRSLALTAEDRTELLDMSMCMAEYARILDEQVNPQPRQSPTIAKRCAVLDRLLAAKCRPSEDVCLEHGRPLATARACEVNCRHRTREQHNDTVTVCGKLKVVKSLRCSDCGHWLPLGPAAADTPEVRIEIDAARRAAFNRETKYTPGYDRFDFCVDTMSGVLCALCETLYLVNAINAQHDEKEQT